jgi:parallel beta-helix repeat protein
MEFEIVNAICNNNSWGMFLQTSGNCLIRNSEIQENKGGIKLEQWSIENVAKDNSITGNEQYGIHASLNYEYSILAIENWWGDNSGPYHHSENPGGKGDNVTDFVIFDPWTTSNIAPIPVVWVAEHGDWSWSNASNHSSINFIVRELDIELSFIASLSWDPDGDSIVTYTWDLDEDGVFGKTEEERRINTTRILTSGKVYHFALQVIDDGNLSGIMNFTIKVLTPIYFPDLNITSLSIDNETGGDVIRKGESLSIHFTVTNSGKNESHNEFQIILEKKFDGPGSDWEMVNRMDHQGVLYPGTSISYSFNWSESYQELKYGEYSFRILLDPDNSIQEESEENNVRIGRSIHLINIIPTVFINAPSKGEIVFGTVMVSGDASDVDGDVENVQLAINNKNVEGLAGISSWSYYWNTTDLEPGEYSISVRSFDGWNYSKEARIVVIIQDDEGDREDEDSDDVIWFIAAILVMNIAILGMIVKKRGRG